MTQDRLAVVLRKLFPSTEYKIHTNVRKLGDVQSPFSGIYLELDYWIPALKLAFEYQDPHHYESTSYTYAEPKRFSKGDLLKKETLLERGDTLISVPYWWDGKEESLIATILLERKDLFSRLPSVPLALSSPIPSLPPIAEAPGNVIEKVGIPGVGTLMLASFASSSMLSLDSWWMTEKYDGTRVCWNPISKILYGRNAEKDYSEKSKITNPKAKFQFLRVLGFDCPPKFEQKKTEKKDKEFEERYKIMLDSVPADHSLVILVDSTRCQGKFHLRNFTQKIIGKSGEGVVARKPKSTYVHGRTETMLKFKAYRDWEGLIIDIDQNDYYILMSDGTIIQAPISSSQSCQMPEIGNVVTFISISGSHESIFEPRFTRVVAVRDDITWRDVVENANCTEREYTSTLLHISEKAISDQPTKQPQGFWTTNESENTRKYFDEFANSRNFDPLVAENWYQFQGSDFKNSTSIMCHYNSSFYKALSSVYPNIGLEMNKFNVTPHHYWTEKDNRKRFFDDFAKNHKPPFDPLIPENWYPFSGTFFHGIKGGPSVMSIYSGSLIKAVTEVYPDVLFDEYKFKFKPKEFWNNLENRRKFFTQYAQKIGFDPLVASNWYGWQLDIMDKEHNSMIIYTMYNGSYANALVSLFFLKSVGNVLHFFEKNENQIFLEKINCM